MAGRTATYRTPTCGCPTAALGLNRDGDRVASFRRAIAACVQEFQRTHARAPIVLDFGCGSGVLASCALHAGASHVTAVDCNVELMGLTRALLVAEGFREGDDFAVCDALPDRDAATFDVLIADVLGTLALSDADASVFESLDSHVRRFDVGRERFCVPQAVHQYACLTRFPDLFGEGDAAARAAQLCFAPLFGTWTGRELQMFATNETHLPFHELRFERMQDRMRVHTDRLGARGKPLRFTETMADFSLPGGRSDGSVLLVIEWECELWDGVQVANTLEGYGNLSAIDRACRHATWGFMAARIARCDGSEHDTGPRRIRCLPGRGNMVRMLTTRASRARA